MPVSAMMLSGATGGGGGGTSTPDAIFGAKLLAWYKRGTGLYTDTGTTLVSADGDNIMQWSDQTANGYHLLRETVDANTGPISWRPGTTYAGAGTLDFNAGAGNTGWFKIPNALGSALNTSSGEMWVSLANRGPATGGHAAQSGGWDMTASSDHCFFPFGSGGIYDTFGVTSRVNAIPSTILDDLGFHVWNARAASGSYEAYLDSTQVQAPVARTISFRTTGSVWGVSDTRVLHLNAYVCELAFVKPPFDSTERGNMLNYMQGL